MERSCNIKIITDKDWKRTWKEAVEICLWVLTIHLSRGTEESH